MNARHLVVAGAVALSTVGCGATIKTVTDYNRHINFSKYQSFYVKSGHSFGKPLNATSNASITQQAIDEMFATFPPERTALARQG